MRSFKLRMTINFLWALLLHASFTDLGRISRSLIKFQGQIGMDKMKLKVVFSTGSYLVASKDFYDCHICRLDHEHDA